MRRVRSVRESSGVSKALGSVWESLCVLLLSRWRIEQRSLLSSCRTCQSAQALKWALRSEHRKARNYVNTTFVFPKSMPFQVIIIKDIFDSLLNSLSVSLLWVSPGELWWTWGLLLKCLPKQTNTQKNYNKTQTLKVLKQLYASTALWHRGCCQWKVLWVLWSFS